MKGVVENAVNTVGIDLNTASSSLLGYVSGITPSIAKNIIEYRETNGAFRNRKELLKVKRLGASSFEQCAGFLRIKDGTEVLDNTLVHPESYDKAYASDELNADSAETSKEFEKIDFPQLATQLEVGIPTLKDIVSELKKPGRDIRPKRNPVEFLSEIMTLDDLKEDMVLTGTVRNVLDFGAFVDIGLKSDGLVHISELSDKYVKHPLDIVRIGDIVTVRVIKIDRERGKVGLSMKQLPQH